MRIRKFNESLTHKGIDLEYIDECFLDFIDEGVYFERDCEVYFMDIPMYSYDGTKTNNVNEFTSILEKAYNNSLLLQSCIEKVKVKYPELNYIISMDNRSDTTICVSFIVD